MTLLTHGARATRDADLKISAPDLNMSKMSVLLIMLAGSVGAASPATTPEAGSGGTFDVSCGSGHCPDAFPPPKCVAGMCCPSGTDAFASELCGGMCPASLEKCVGGKICDSSDGDTLCGGQCVGFAKKCVGGTICDSSDENTLCGGQCFGFGQTCCMDTTICGFDEICTDDGTCIENTARRS